MGLLQCLTYLLAAVVATDVSGKIEADNFSPTTRVTLRTSHSEYVVPVLQSGDFTFSNVDAGSYVLQVNCMTHAFPLLRVDVSPKHNEEGTLAEDGSDVVIYKHALGTSFNPPGTRVTYPILLRPVNVIDYYLPRSSFNPLNLLKNPMALIGILMAFSLFILPKLTQLLDPEGIEEMNRIKAEKQKEAKAAAADNPALKLQNFDVSGWLAGKK